MSQNQPIFNVPRSTLLALAALAAVHGVRLLLDAETDVQFLLTLAFIPARYAGVASQLPGGEIAALTSFVTYMFVHGDLMHLLVNGVWMLAFGSAVALRVGDGRFVLFSLACGIAGAVLHLALHFGALAPVVGASAAISGQMAAAVRFLFSAGGQRFAGDRRLMRLVPLASVWETLRNPRILVFIGVWFAINALFGTGLLQFQGAEGGIAWEAHLGGFTFGLVAFGLFDRRPGPDIRREAAVDDDPRWLN